MNIYEKLQKCRVDLQNSKLKKSGKNKFANYDYFELGDFLPRINELLHENKLASIFSFNTDAALLTIVDTEKTEDKLSFSTPVAMAELKGTHAIQNIGATQTYVRRYLYVMAFEITDCDALDAIPPKDDSEKKEIAEFESHKNKKINATKLQTLRNLITDSHSNEKKFCDFYGIASLEEVINDQFVTMMKALENRIEINKKKAKEKPIEQPTEPIEELNI
jgi:hypothetical protein